MLWIKFHCKFYFKYLIINVFVIIFAFEIESKFFT